MKTPTLSRKVIVFPVRCPASVVRYPLFHSTFGVRCWMLDVFFFRFLRAVLRRPSFVMSLLAALVLAGAGCSTPPKVVRTDPEIERNTAVARGAYAAGAADKAAVHYQKALQRSRVMDAPVEIAHNAYNLAVCLAARRSYDEARSCIDEARLEFQRAGIACPELPLLEAKIARAQGHLQEAENLARAEQKKPDGLNDAIRVQWQLLLAELLCDQGRADEAQAELAAIGSKQLKASGTETRAQTAQTQARVRILKQNPQEAARQYDTAARLWQEAGRYGEMANALDQAGRAYEDAGDSLSAADRCYRAARSLFESGHTVQAEDPAGRALRLATAAHQSALQKQAERLKAEIDGQTQKAQPSAK
jgi:tetratricopeptide (TPR) repeat protein